MQCPLCPQSPLVIAERQEVEIEYCPRCRGVWLDRGELDKLIAREGRPHEPSMPAHGGQPRRRSWLSDIFD